MLTRCFLYSDFKLNDFVENLFELKERKNNEIYKTCLKNILLQQPINHLSKVKFFKNIYFLIFLMGKDISGAKPRKETSLQNKRNLSIPFKGQQAV